ncbi:MAG: hypothetical protein CM15mP70_03300 [Pelagibacteraceae bacterium]|nr:MAG: hypothetical protein CM15mP70_03300 [Pelagibacteraceae bacterium]
MYLKNFQNKNKRLVTGAGKGIGKAAAFGFWGVRG